MSNSALQAYFPSISDAGPEPAQVYFDNAATTQKTTGVIQAFNDYHSGGSTNVHRASDDRSATTTRQFEAARQSVQGFINARLPAEIIWTKGATEAINLVAHGLTMLAGDAGFSHGRRILVSATEHHANLLPWQTLAACTGMQIDVIPVDADGVWKLEDGLALLTENTALVAIGQVSNALGNVNPITPLLKMAHELGAVTLLDGAQAVAHQEVDVQALGCDFYVFSGHKMYGPTGIGVLYGKMRWLERLPPYQTGGEMVAKVGFHTASFQPPPLKFEAGTPNIAATLAMAEAVKFVQQHRQEMCTQEQRIYQRLIAGLARVPGLKVWGDTEQNIGIASFTLDGLDSQDIGILLNQRGISVRVGHHCAMPLMDTLGIPGTVRVSLACYNTANDVERLLDALQDIVRQLQEDSGARGQNEAPSAVTSNPSAKAESGQLQEKFLGPLATNIQLAKGWDEKYRQLMLASKYLDSLPAQQRGTENEIYGCESQVWLSVEVSATGVQLQAWANSKIVRGLLALMIEPLQGRSAKYVSEFDITAYLAEIGLGRHLSPSRGNGLNAVLKAIHSKVNPAS